MKTLYLLICVIFISHAMPAQGPTQKLYNPVADVKKDMSDLLKQAAKEKKNVFVMAGGNWCSWCLEFNRFSHAEPQVDSILRADYLVYHMNYSPENKNLSALAKLGYPQRFGFPVFIILDENGNRLHTQNSAYLEQGRSYNKRKVTDFLLAWRRAAYNPSSYNSQ